MDFHDVPDIVLCYDIIIFPFEVFRRYRVKLVFLYLHIGPFPLFYRLHQLLRYLHLLIGIDRFLLPIQECHAVAAFPKCLCHEAQNRLFIQHDGILSQAFRQHHALETRDQEFMFAIYALLFLIHCKGKAVF